MHGHGYNVFEGARGTRSDGGRRTATGKNSEREGRKGGRKGGRERTKTRMAVELNCEPRDRNGESSNFIRVTIMGQQRRRKTICKSFVRFPIKVRIRDASFRVSLTTQFKFRTQHPELLLRYISSVDGENSVALRRTGNGSHVEGTEKYRKKGGD